MSTKITWIAVALTMLIAVGAAQAAGKKAPKYVGAVKCKTCHKKELIGNQYGEWQKSPHAKALEALKSDDAKKIAAERGLAKPADESPECLKCHVTAYDADPSLLPKKGLKHSDGVQCESCHGPGSKYRKKKTMSDHKKAVAAGMWEPGKDQKICTNCHNDKSPTWDPAKGFDYEAAKEKIAHAIPKDVKGKYLEIEKERKASGGGSDDEDEDDEDE